MYDFCPQCGAQELCETCHANLYDDMVVECVKEEKKIFIGSGEDAMLDYVTVVAAA